MSRSPTTERIRLADRRLQLQVRAAAKREELGQAFGVIEARLHPVDQVLLKARGYARKPLLLAGVAGLALLVGPRRILRFGGKAMLVLSAARRIMGMVR